MTLRVIAWNCFWQTINLLNEISTKAANIPCNIKCTCSEFHKLLAKNIVIKGKKGKFHLNGQLPVPWIQSYDDIFHLYSWFGSVSVTGWSWLYSILHELDTIHCNRSCPNHRLVMAASHKYLDKTNHTVSELNSFQNSTCLLQHKHFSWHSNESWANAKKKYTKSIRDESCRHPILYCCRFYHLSFSKDTVECSWVNHARWHDGMWRIR